MIKNIVELSAAALLAGYGKRVCTVCTPQELEHPIAKTGTEPSQLIESAVKINAVKAKGSAGKPQQNRS